MPARTDHVEQLRLRLRWVGLRLSERLGFWQMLALALVVLWAGLVLRVNAPLGAHLARLEAERQALAEDASRMRTTAPAATPSASRKLLGGLPDDATRERQVGQIQALAVASGVVVERIDYRLESGRKLPVRKLVLRFSGAGPYSAHRRFLHEVLRRHRNAAVERMGLEREKDGVGSLRLSLDVALYFREAS